MAIEQLTDYNDLIAIYQLQKRIQENHNDEDKLETDYQDELSCEIVEEYCQEDADDTTDDDNYEEKPDYLDEKAVKREFEDYAHSKKICLIFYLRYIHALDQYQSKYGENSTLDTAKRRLLYALNDSRRHLYNEDNFQLELSKISIDDLDVEEDFYDFYVMCSLFLIDIFENYISINDELTLRKLLFVQTYYDLTKDKKIIELIEKNSHSNLYQKVKSVVLKHKQFDEEAPNRLQRKKELHE